MLERHENDDALHAELDGGLRLLARTLVADDAAADDLVQEAWLAALDRPPGSLRNPRAWMRRVVRNLAFRERARSLRREDVESLWAPEESASEEGARVDSRSSANSLREAVAALREPYRGVLREHFFEERTVAETARRLGRPLETVKCQVKRGIRELRALLDRRHAGDRGAWVIVLAPLVPEAPPVGGARGVATGATRAARLLGGGPSRVLAVLSLAALVLVFPWSANALGGSTVREVAQRELGAPASAAPATPDAGRSGGGSREPVGAAPTTEPAVVEAMPAVPAPDARTLLLRVLDEDGRTASRAWAHVWGKDADFLGEFVSDDDGVVRIDVEEDLLEGPPRVPGPHGGVRVTARLEGGAWSPLYHLELPPGEREFEVRSPGPGQDVVGVVVDEAGRPVEGAFLGVAPERYGARPDGEDTAYPERDYSAWLENSSFTLRGLPFRTHRMAVRAPGFQPDRQIVRGDDEMVEVRFVLREGAVLSGVVLRPDGAPAGGADVWETGLDGQAGEPPSPRTTADRFGRFELRGIEAGERRFFAGDPESEDRYATTTLEVPEGGTLEWAAELREDSGVRVRVTELDDTPIEGALVVLLAEEGPTWGKVLGSDAEGRAQFSRPPGGRLTLAIGRTLSDRAPSRIVSDVSSSPDELVVRLDPPPRRRASVQGVLLDHDGRPFEDALVVGCSDAFFECDVDLISGLFRVNDVRGGTYEFWAHLPGRGRADLGVFEVAEDGTTDLGILRTEPPGVLDLEVDGPSGEISWVVDARGPCASGSSGSPSNGKVVVAGDSGRAELELLPGEYRLRTTVRGETRDLAFVVRSGEHLALSADTR